jgi:hypothetical protein
LEAKPCRKVLSGTQAPIFDPGFNLLDQILTLTLTLMYKPVRNLSA